MIEKLLFHAKNLKPCTVLCFSQFFIFNAYKTRKILKFYCFIFKKIKSFPKSFSQYKKNPPKQRDKLSIFFKSKQKLCKYKMKFPRQPKYFTFDILANHSSRSKSIRCKSNYQSNTFTYCFFISLAFEMLWYWKSVSRNNEKYSLFIYLLSLFNFHKTFLCVLLREINLNPQNVYLF